MKIRTIDWDKNSIKIIDQTKLPNEFNYIYLKDIKQLFAAIRSMKIRGAPALAAAGALGVVLAACNIRRKKPGQFIKELLRVIDYLSTSRPTAVNLFWGLERMKKVIEENKNNKAEVIKSALLSEGRKIMQEDRIACRKMAKAGSRLIKNGDRVLTICNAGILATIDYGTALGVFYQAKKEKKRFRVFACETRPLLQGARLTTWELSKNHIDVTLICDSMAAVLMSEKKIDKIFVGADRIARNGDTANKVGTYNLAVLAKWHRIPFYVVAPLSSFDNNIKTGRDIPIEQRSCREITHSYFKKPIVPPGVKVFNPAFDVTGHELITAIITEKGILRFPDR